MSRRRCCPGNCGRSIPPGLFACRRCSKLVPYPVRRRIIAAAGKPMTASKRTAWADGTEWLTRLVRG